MFQLWVQNSQVYEIKIKILYVFSYIHIRRAIRICGCTGDAHFSTIRILSEQVRDRGTIQISGSCGTEEQDSGEKEGPEAR